MWWRMEMLSPKIFVQRKKKPSSWFSCGLQNFYFFLFFLSPQFFWFFCVFSFFLFFRVWVRVNCVPGLFEWLAFCLRVLVEPVLFEIWTFSIHSIKSRESPVFYLVVLEKKNAFHPRCYGVVGTCVHVSIFFKYYYFEGGGKVIFFFLLLVEFLQSSALDWQPKNIGPLRMICFLCHISTKVHFFNFVGFFFFCLVSFAAMIARPLFILLSVP